MGRIIGIDLGTTNSVGAYWSKKRAKVIENDRTQSYLTPSVVTLDLQGNRIVGQDAKDRLGASTQDVIFSIKRFMGMDCNDPKVQAALKKFNGYPTEPTDDSEIQVKLGNKAYKPVEISAMILGQIKRDAELQLGESVTHAVITVPAYFSQRQKDATREAGRLAGLNVARIINEPTAAALAFGVENDSDDAKYVLVYDLGGGTFDVSILLTNSGRNFDVFNVDGDNFLGGDDFDNLLVNEILEQIGRPALRQDKLALRMLKNIAEQVKIELSRSDSVSKPISFMSERGEAVDLLFKITRAQFERMIQPQIDCSIEIVQRALSNAHLDIDEISHVLLVGGSTRIPLVRQCLKKMFGEDKIEIDVDPMQCVALGAAVQSAALLQEELSDSFDPTEITGIDLKDAPQISITDVTSKHIAIEVEEENGKETLTVVIQKGTIFPMSDPYRKEFYTSSFDQRMYKLPIYEIEAATVEHAESTPREQWEQVGFVKNDQLPPGLPKGTPIMVEMSIDHDGIITVSSYVKADKEQTFIEKSLHMSASRNSSALSILPFYSFMFTAIVETDLICKYLHPGQEQQIRQLAAKAEETVKDGTSGANAKQLLEQMRAMENDWPAPVRDLFFALWYSNHQQIPTIEKNQTKQTIFQLDRSISQGDIDTANQHLRVLQTQITDMEAKLPSGLLMRNR